MVVGSVDRVTDVRCYSVKSATKAVVLAVVVVISHITLVLLWGVNSCPGLLGDLDLRGCRGYGSGSCTCVELLRLLTELRLGVRVVLRIVGADTGLDILLMGLVLVLGRVRRGGLRELYCVTGLDTLSVFSLGLVDDRRSVGGSRGVGGSEVRGWSLPVRNVDLGVDVSAVGFGVALTG